MSINFSALLEIKSNRFLYHIKIAIVFWLRAPVQINPSDSSEVDPSFATKDSSELLSIEMESFLLRRARLTIRITPNDRGRTLHRLNIPTSRRYK